VSSPHILIIPSWYPTIDNPTAGAFIKQQVDALEMAGCSVDVLYLDKKYSRLQLITSLAGNYSDAFDGVHKAGFTPDIIHVHALWPAGLGAVAISKKYDIPFVVTEHSEEYSRGTERKLIRTPGMLPFVLRPLAQKAAAYIAPSTCAAKRLEELGLYSPVQVISNVVPVRQPAPLSTKEPKRIVHVSQLGPAKNLSLLLRAIARLRDRRNDFVLDIVGDGQCRDKYAKLASELHLDGAVGFHGRASTDEVNAHLDRAAFGVLASDHETFSVFAAECLMAGRPVVSTRCGGPEGFIGSEQGMLVDTGNLDSLVAALDHMLDHYTDYDPIALNAYAAERFSPSVVSQQLLELYADVLGGSR